MMSVLLVVLLNLRFALARPASAARAGDGGGGRRGRQPDVGIRLHEVSDCAAAVGGPRGVRLGMAGQSVAQPTVGSTHLRIAKGGSRTCAVAVAANLSCERGCWVVVGHGKDKMRS